MTSKRSHPTGRTIPPGADNFQLLEGIGPGIERRLHHAGVLTFAQLAALAASELAELVADVAGMSAERIANWDWVGQARELAARSAASQSQDALDLEPVESYDDAALNVSRQHLERFRVELLLDENNDVRRTRVAHVKSGGDDTWDEAWAGWKDARLLSFFVQHAALQMRSAEPAASSVATIEPALLPAAAVELAPSIVPTVEPTSPTTAAVEPMPSPVPAAGLAGELRLTALHMLPTIGAEPRRILRYEQAFDIQIVLDLDDVIRPRDVPLGYIATVYAKSLRGGPSQIVAEARNTIAPADGVSISIEGKTPPQGIYRLEATVALTLAAESTSRSDLVAFIEGGLLQIY